MLTKLKEVGIKLTVFGACGITFCFAQAGIVRGLMKLGVSNADRIWAVSLSLFNHLIVFSVLGLVIGSLLLFIRVIAKWVAKH